MGRGIPIEGERQQLAHFLRRRQGHDRLVALLKEVKEKHDLKRGCGVNASQSLSYDQIVSSLDEAMSRDWLEQSELLALLDELETAGRQHILIHEVRPDSDEQTEHAEGIERILRTPRHRRTDVAELGEYWDVPAESFARVMRDDANVLTVKLVTSRTYHTVEPLGSTPEYEDIRKRRHNERAAVIVKLLKQEGLVQIRVPPREKGSGDTAKAVYELANVLATRHFGSPFFNHISPIAMADAFPPIVANRIDFVLEKDTPSDGDTCASMSRLRDADGNIVDLRDSEKWTFGNGCARTSVRGSWKIGETKLYTHVHCDEIRLNKTTTCNAARVFVPDRCTDEELDHVIRRVYEHSKQCARDSERAPERETRAS